MRQTCRISSVANSLSSVLSSQPFHASQELGGLQRTSQHGRSSKFISRASGRSALMGGASIRPASNRAPAVFQRIQSHSRTSVYTGCKNEKRNPTGLKSACVGLPCHECHKWRCGSIMTASLNVAAFLSCLQTQRMWRSAFIPGLLVVPKPELRIQQALQTHEGHSLQVDQVAAK